MFIFVRNIYGFVIAPDQTALLLIFAHRQCSSSNIDWGMNSCGECLSYASK